MSELRNTVLNRVRGRSHQEISSDKVESASYMPEGVNANSLWDSGAGRESLKETHMRSPLITLFFLLALGIASFAAEIRKGSTMQEKPNSIWFQDAAKLARWQQLKKSGNSKALASYQNDVLSNRDAWQLLNRSP
jgi:hypothetical protein